MVALTKDRDTPKRANQKFGLPVAAATQLFAGGIGCLNAAGYVVPGGTGTTLTAVGRISEQVDNTAGADGEQSVELERGLFRFTNSTVGDEILREDIGNECYIVDDQTVAKTDGVGARSVAGIIRDIDGLGVWVEIGKTKDLTAVADLDFASVAAAASVDLTITVPNAAVNDAVALGSPSASVAGLVYQAFVSAADTVTVRATNITAAAIDPASATFRATVIKA